jgi:hypothetical protein
MVKKTERALSDAALPRHRIRRARVFYGVRDCLLQRHGAALGKRRLERRLAKSLAHLPKVTLAQGAVGWFQLVADRLAQRLGRPRQPHRPLPLTSLRRDSRRPVEREARFDRVPECLRKRERFAVAGARAPQVAPLVETLATPGSVAIDPTGNLAIVDEGNNRVVLLETPTPIVTSLALKVSPRTGTAKFVVCGFGRVSGSAVVEVNGTALSTTRCKELAADGSARRLAALDPSFDALVPPGVPVSVTIFNPLTGSRSAPVPFTR